MTEQRTLRLGKLAPRHDPRTLKLTDYLTALPSTPSSFHLERNENIPAWPIYGNDRYGDCVFADIGHQIMAWTGWAGQEQTVTDAEVLAAYSAVTGFDPNQPSTDQGTVWLDALNYWRKTGIGGHRIDAYVSVPVDQAHARAATFLFGGLQLGIALPISAQAQVGKVWTIHYGPTGRWGSWGGHAVPVLGWDYRYVYVITWGNVQRMTWGFFRRYVDESYAALSHDWLTAEGKSPEGFDWQTLQSDLASV